jgi:hypothetical protein
MLVNLKGYYGVPNAFASAELYHEIGYLRALRGPVNAYSVKVLAGPPAHQYHFAFQPKIMTGNMLT